MLGQLSIWGQEFLNFHLSTDIQRKEVQSGMMMTVFEMIFFLKLFSELNVSV